MENLNTTQRQYHLSFHGTGSEYFGVIIVNWLLTILTLGLYYPWAKSKELKYLYGSTELNNDRFEFHGTGKEMFKGFIKAILIFACIFFIFFLLIYIKKPMFGLIFFYLSIFAIMPLAIHGAYKYRMSRTSWRGIRFGYRGDRNELIKKFFTGIFFTIITIGFYSPWFGMNLRNYIISNIKFGDIEFKSDGDGFDYFTLIFKGYFFTIITLGVYLFWWQKDMFNYYIEHTSLHKGESKINLSSAATGGGFFQLMIINLLIIIFTLGLGYSWAVTRTMKYITSIIQLEGDIDLDSLNQTEDNFKDATGEDMNDIFDNDFII